MVWLHSVFHLSIISIFRCLFSSLSIDFSRMDATLREITSLMKEVNPDARRKGTVFDFSLVAPNMGPGPVCFRMRHIGNTTAGIKGTDDNKTLAQCR